MRKFAKRGKKKKKFGISSVAGQKGLPLNINECWGKIQAPFQLPYPPGTLSIIMIVKDEADNIEKAIKSFLPVADEIIVNDTGSSDGTQTILEGLDVIWFQTQWQDDFSLARNQAIERARSAWIIWMDADDRIPLNQVENFLKLKQAPLDRIFGFQVINTQAGQPLGARFMQLRMFPNHPDISFERRVHEQFIFSAARLGLHCFYLETVIHHTGYESDEKKRQKARRNLKYAEMEKRLLGVEPTFTTCLGDSYFILEDWEKGLEAYKQAFTIPNLRAINKDVYAVLPNNIGLGYQNLKRYEEAIDWFRKAVELNSDNIEPVYHIGECLQFLDKKIEAIKTYLRVIEMPLVFSSTANQYDSIRIFAYHHLAQLLMEKGDYAEAIKRLNDMHRHYPQIIETWEMLGDALLRTENPIGAADAWIQAVELNPGKFERLYDKLLPLLEKLGREEERLRYVGLRNERFSEKLNSNAPSSLKAGNTIQVMGNTSTQKAKASGINLSLCMIVRNEERDLSKCLASASDLFDETVIVDTGSTDGTCRVAQTYGARILTASWEKDFSKARNVSLEAANGHWLFWLDADDVILPPDKKTIHKLALGPPDRAYGFQVQNSADGGLSGTVFNQIRMFPNRPDVRFSSPIHEQVLPALEQAGVRVEYSPAKIIHTGYRDPAVARKKQMRNRVILENQIKQGAGVTAVTLYTLANACLDLGEFEAALEWFIKSAEKAEKTGTNPHILQIGPTKAAVALAGMKRYKEALKALDLSLAQEKVLPETWLVKAQVEAALGNEQTALGWFTRLLDVKEELSFIPIDYKLLKIKALEFLGGYWHRKGKRELAINILKRGIGLKSCSGINRAELREIYNRFGIEYEQSEQFFN